MAFRQLNTTPNPLAFGDVEVGQSSDLVLTIQNDPSSAPSPNITGNVGNPSDGQFTIVSGGGAFNLAQGASKQVTVRFTPASTGAKAATISVSHDGTTPASPITVDLTGTGRVKYKTVSWTDWRNKKGDLLKIIMVFDRSDGSFEPSATENVTGESLKIFPSKAGSLAWRYNLDDFFLSLGTWQPELLDDDGNLRDLFYGGIYKIQAKVKVEVKYGGVGAYSTEFIGRVLENTISRPNYVFGDGKILTFIASPKTNILNETRVYGDSNEALNPLGYTEDTWKYLKDIILDCYKEANPMLASSNVEIIHDWVWRAGVTVGQSDLTDVNINELQHLVNFLFFDSSFGVKTLGDVLRQLAIDYCAFTGMVHEDRVFFKKIFQTNPSNVVTKVAEHKEEAKLTKLKWVHVRSYFSLDKLQFEDYYLPDSSQSSKSGNPDENMDRETMYGFDTSYTVVLSQRSGIPYQVWGVKDASISGSSFWTSAQLVAELWYERRTDEGKLRIDYFKLNTIDIDPIESFRYSGVDYSPLEVVKDLDESQTEINALVV